MPHRRAATDRWAEIHEEADHTWTIVGHDFDPRYGFTTITITLLASLAAALVAFETLRRMVGDGQSTGGEQP